VRIEQLFSDALAFHKQASFFRVGEEDFAAMK
jgi:hypothetical protein